MVDKYKLVIARGGVFEAGDFYPGDFHPDDFYSEDFRTDIPYVKNELRAKPVEHELGLKADLFDIDDYDEDYFLIQRQEYKYRLKAKRT